MNAQLKVSLALVGAFILVVGGFLVLNGGDDDDTSKERQSSSLGDEGAVRDGGRVIGQEGTSDVVFVEFLDFECEACGAAYPVIEQLREDYEGQVTFVARYFPIPSHFNAERAARAVESAALQGKFEEMYQMMYETQSDWAEQQTPHDDLFRGYAEDLGLDMDKYDADYASDEVAETVQQDAEDGVSMGVEGTPTFFLNGEKFEPRTVEEFTEALDQALAE